MIGKPFQNMLGSRRSWFALAALVAGLSLVESAHAAQFEFRQDRPDAGTYVRRVIGSASIPLDKTYGELNESALKLVRESFPKLKPSDEPPFPEKSLRPLISLATTLRYQTDGISRVNLVLQVDESGTARVVSAADSNDEQFFSGVMSLLAATKFKPGRCDGKPCAMEFPFGIEFEGIGRSARRSPE